MRPFGPRSIYQFSLASLILVSSILICLWGQQSGLLQEAQRAEGERLFQAFSPGLAKAIGQNDDLARIDELRRLQKIPGVEAVVISNPSAQSNPGSALVWEGQRVGHLEIRMQKSRWRLWLYRWLERALTLCVTIALLGGGLGFYWNRAKQRHCLRVIGMLEREHARMKRYSKTERAQADMECKRRIEQAMNWISGDLLILDSRQHIMMANCGALEHFHLSANNFGSHWLEFAASPEWAVALRRSIENPGVRTPGANLEGAKPVSLLTYSKPGDSTPESTWIFVDQPS